MASLRNKSYTESFPVRMLIVLVSASSLLSGCELFSSDPDEIKTLQINRITWNQVRTPDYSYTHTRSCFCAFAGTYRVTVRDDQVAGATDVVDLEPVPLDYLIQIPTLDGVFDLLEAAYNNEADEIHVEYGRYGIPEIIDIDFIEGAIDDELSLRSTDVTLGG